MLILFLVGLSGCAAHRPEDATTAVIAPSPLPSLVVTASPSGDGLVLIGRPGGTYYNVPASIAYSAETREWYERGQEAIARRKAMSDTSGGTRLRVSVDPTVAAATPSIPVVPCPKDRDPVTLPETVACQNAEIKDLRADVHDLKKTDDAIINAVGVDQPK